MKIAFFVADYPNPSETFIARQIVGMQALGHQVTIIAGNLKAPFEEMRGEGLTVQLIREQRTGLGVLALRLSCGLRSLIRWRRLRGVIQGLKMGSLMPAADLFSCPRHLGSFDAIVAHFGPMGVRADILRRADLLKGPLTVVFHGKDMSDHWTLERYLPSYRQLFQSAERLLPISRLWRDQLISWGAPPTKIQILRMGVDFDALHPLPDDRPLSRPVRVLSVARFVEKKGLQYAIEGVKKARSAIEYHIIGFGPLEETLAKKAQSQGNTVKFLGRKSHSEVFAELRAADIFLLPSVVAADGDMEGIPVALMEAMAMGVLVIATHHSGIPELIEDNSEGLLVPERNAAPIARALERLASGSVDIAAMRKAARAKVRLEFNNANLDHELEAILTQLQPSVSQRGAVKSAPPAVQSLST
ncbi:MAG: glycosyltransferase [Sphingobium sp.]|uniref:glycosyltransferase n=1 Tax=Sphingobium sp. TaxID=1912891 RepID=UPI0029A1D6E9|nr:glycosyltransferase [Sphingobium sp.]MDX3908899.1 glycosyltransferase [Sphingobium sp.]